MQTHHGSGDNVYGNKYVNESGKPRYPRELTLLPRPPERVVGRDKQLQIIHRRFATVKAPIVLITGLGGIGKTTVALQFIEENKEDFQHLVWIEVTDTIPAAFVSNTTLIRNLHLQDHLERLDRSTYEADAFVVILNTLNQLPDCLLVIDNANNLADLERCEQRLRSLHAKTLLTSRNQPEGWTTVPIDELSKRDAFLLFTLHFGKTVEATQVATVHQLLECLHRHTLLIELIAKAATKANLSLEVLYAKVRHNYLSDEDLNRRAVKTDTHADHTRLPKQARIEAYIKMVFNQISTLSDAEQHYLRYLTLLPSNEYLEPFLLEVFTYQPDEDKPPVNKDEVLDALDSLTQKGWLRLKHTDQGATYQLHSLVQQVALQQLGLADTLHLVAFFREKIHYRNTDPSHQLAEKYAWKEYGDYLAQLFWPTVHKEVSYLLDRLAYLYEHYGQYATAARLGERALEIDLQLYNANHPNVATRQSNLANVYDYLGQYERARDLLEQALESAINHFGDQHPTVAIRQSNLALVYKNLGQYEQARDLLEESLQLTIEVLDKKHPEVAIRQSNLALVYQDLGQYEQARDLLQQALASDIANFGDQHPTVAVHQSNLGMVVEALGDQAYAKELYEQPLASDLKNFGEEHPNVATRYNNLIAVYVHLGAWEQAQEAADKNVAIWMKIVGPEHPNTKRAEGWRAWLAAQRGAASEP